jgi:predicted RNA-binding Zn ribbon-like protein
LDFANTAEWTCKQEIVERFDVLLEPHSLERWGARAGLAGGAVGPGELELARSLRAELHSIFSALARGDQPEQRALERLRTDYVQAVAAGTVTRGEGGRFELRWSPTETRGVRFAVAVDAFALLADMARLARLRRCPGRDCGWLFLDASGRRKWCSMSSCGSREKMRRMYTRKRASADSRRS